MDDNHSSHAWRWPNRVMLFSLAGVALIVAALAGAMAVTAPFQRPPTLLKETGLFVCAGVGFAAVFVLLYLAFSVGGSVLLHDIPGALESISSKIGDVDAVWRQQDNVRTTADRIEQVVCSEHEILEGLRQDLARELLERQSLEGLLIAQLQREAEHLGQDLAAGKQERERLQERIERWRDAAIQIIEQVGQGSHEVDSGSSQEQSDALQLFSQALTPLGLELILPVLGESLDRSIHETPGKREDTLPLSGIIATCAAPGFRWENEVLRKARVHLADPAAENEEPPMEWSKTLVEKQSAACIVSIPTSDGQNAVLIGWETYAAGRERANDSAGSEEPNNVE